MPDILSQGGDREPRAWPRRVAAVVALLVVTAVIVQRLTSHPPAAARASQAATTATPAASAPPAAGLPAGPSGITGPTLPWPATLRVPATGAQPEWFWPVTGRGQPIGGLPQSSRGYAFIRVGGGWAIQPAAPVRLGSCGCGGAPLPVYFLADGARSVTGIGTADLVAPAATPGALWLTSYPPGTDSSTAAGTAREVSVTGASAGPQVRLPAGYVIDRATVRGLLLVPVVRRPGATADKLWDPAAPQASRAFSGVIATNATEIASVTGCARLCQVHVLDLATGRVTVVRLAGVSSAASAAFSPDGAFLALEVTFYGGSDDGQIATQLDVASTATGRVTALRSTYASSDALAGFGWPSGGRTLVAEMSFTTRLELAAWRPGAGRLALAVVRSRQNTATLVVG